MPKTLANLRDALASALGHTYAEFDGEPQTQSDIDTIINAAYLECYAPKDGRLPSWAVQDWSDIVKAPASATLGLTNGSTTVTGFAFEAKYAGSFVKIGDAFYRLASVEAGPIYKLVEPWSGTTGSQAATVYYNAVALPGTVKKVLGTPTLLGIGPLSPLPFSQSEIELRSTPSFDFEPKTARVAFATSRPRFDPSLLTDVGDPRCYHINSTAPGATFATGSRLHVYPLPGAVHTVALIGTVLPSLLANTTDVPVLPHDDVDIAGAILEPLMYERLLKHPLGRRYAGNNIPAIFQGGVDARALLNTFRRVQLDGPKQVRVASGW